MPQIYTQIIIFIIKHWPIWLLLLATMIALVYVEYKIRVVGTQGLAPAKLVALINSGNSLVIVDLRDQESFLQGRIIGSINLPLSDFIANFSAASARLGQYKNQQVILVDRAQTSIKVQDIMNKLTEQGFANLALLGGGIAAWKEANLPLVKK